MSETGKNQASILLDLTKTISMNKEVQYIIRNIQTVNTGQPWYGRSVFEMLDETDPSKAAIKPNNFGHSALELLYHLLTWAEFTLKSLESAPDADIIELEKQDWREIDPAVHDWKKGLVEYKTAHERIIQILENKTDDFLGEMVNLRKYNFRFLLNGLIQHNIYHIGQIAYINKFLV